MIPLPVISCDDCGACCTHVGTPPGFVFFFIPPEKMSAGIREMLDSEDARILASAPLEARQILADYYAGWHAGTTPDRTAEPGAPCLWYDALAKRCRYYEYRPTICREFEVGAEGCLTWRREVLGRE